ncbi:MAG: hypothetical protein R6X18_15165 [Chloroflexota bacterium]
MSSESSNNRIVLLIVIVLAVALLVYFGWRAFSPADDGQVEAPSETVCPLATPEFFVVEPVTSPTDQLTQIVTVDLGNGELITITTESGTFTAPFDAFPKGVEIALLPGTTHNLTVQGRVREIRQGECIYGGYMLETTRDRNGDPLVIEQQSP